MIFQARLFWVERLVEFVSSWLWVWPCFICSTFYRNEEWGEDDWNVSIAFTPYQQPSVRTHRQHGGYLSKTDNLLSIVTVHLKTKKLWCQVNIFNSLFWIGRKTETQEYHLVWACCEDVLKKRRERYNENNGLLSMEFKERWWLDTDGRKLECRQLITMCSDRARYRLI